jgi:D-sedoheptulose 7-phosphate isomerase
MIPTGRKHVAALAEPLAALEGDVDRIDAWGRELARVLADGGRLLAAGNGGSAAQAQHLATELVGRYRSDARPALSAIALCTDGSGLTAIGNDYGAQEVFARQVRAHGRPGDVLFALSTSGTSPNVVAAVEAALAGELTAWALTGPAPNPLSELAHDTVSVDAEHTPTVQEIHLIVIHLLCAAVDVAITNPSNTVLLAEKETARP